MAGRGGHGHDVFEQIKIPVVLDGDLAATLANLIIGADQSGNLDQLLFCHYTSPKLQALFDLITTQLDIENRTEDA